MTVLADFDSGVDFLATADPEDLILHLVRSIPYKELTNGQLELKLGDRVVWMLKGRNGAGSTTISPCGVSL